MTAIVEPVQGADAQLETPYREYIHRTRYSRWRDDLGRRETWEESVTRYVDFAAYLTEKSPGKYTLTQDERAFIHMMFLTCRAMGSMRMLMTAGEAAKRDNAAVYNCTAIAVDDPRAFDEAMYLLMCGTGVGFSVERQFIRKLPEVPEVLFPVEDTIVVDDSRRGWAHAFRRLLAQLWSGAIPSWDLSKLRPAGARLKTFGGRASGPEPLDQLFRYAVHVFKSAAAEGGRKLTSVECHGIMCKVGDVVVSGGVRRSAMISLSNPSDDRMRDAKSGAWYDDPTRKHFQLANNSAVWTEKPDVGRFMAEWMSLYQSRSGERGFVNRAAMQDAAALDGRRDPDVEYLTNPCGEILLRSAQCCNLTEIVARPGDTLDDLLLKAEAATIMGTIQSSCTDFEYLRPIWKLNCEEERLLGVSVTGQMDHEILSLDDETSAEWLEALYSRCRQVNTEWAGKLGINESAAITCQKPSGTVSQLVDSASGGHARYARYYVRRTRDSELDPVVRVVRAAGVPCYPDVNKAGNVVFEWPIKAPDDAVTQKQQTALEQLSRWLHFKRHFTEHNPSATITVHESEWMDVGAWVYRNFDEIGGLSFLPAVDHIYEQAPYEEITEEEYLARLADMPETIDWRLLEDIEHDDETSSSRELACTATSCEI